MTQYIKRLPVILLIIALSGCNIEVESSTDDSNHDDSPEDPALIWDEGNWDDDSWS